MLRRDGAQTVVVFSHPNHELAIFGILQSMRPCLVYLTDGGGEKRVEQTRRGLDSIGLRDHAHFLDYTEKSFYEALLNRDAEFYSGVTSRLRDVFERVRPTQVLCDSVEFYNPVHDMSLPLVRAALRGMSGTAVFEVPLVYQRLADTEAYQVQRTSAARREEQLEWALSPVELDAKISARDRIYTILTEQMGALIADIPIADLATEVVTPAATSLPSPDGDRFLRYERRAQILLERGEIEHAITYAEHYLPVAAALF